MKFSLTGNSAGERPLSAVPRPVIVILMAALLMQIGLHGFRSDLESDEQPLPVPPAEKYLYGLSLGDPVAFSKLLMLWLQGFDHQPGISVPFAQLDYQHVIAWLDRVLALDRRGHYPLLSAARIYSEVPDAGKQRQILDFVYRKFLEDPDKRWPWLAHAVYVAKHRLHDPELALKYARDLRVYTSASTAPEWARQMELFVLEDLGDVESAQILLGGLIESGEITEPREIEFLKSRLDGGEE